MKVGAYFPGFIPEDGGGYTFEHEVLLSLCELAQQCRHDLVLIFRNAPGDSMCTILAEKGLKAVQLESPRRMPRLNQVATKIFRKLHIPPPPVAPHPLRAAVEREKIEFIWSVADVYFPVDKVDVPYIATVWDIQHCLQPWFPEVSQSGIWDKREKNYYTFLRRASYIITPNVVGQKELSLFYGLPSERFRLLPHPSPRIEYVPTEEQVNDVLKRYHLASGYLFYPAQFWAHKNHANLLLALQVLKKKFALNKHLVLVGSDKGNMKYVRNLVQTLGLEGQVHFLDFVPRDNLIALYHGAFALTFLSLCGPENLPPMEAFVCGCPVIMSDYSGARQQCADAALFVNGLDPDAIAEAIQELKTQAGRLALIEKGRKRASRYTGEAYILDVFKIFDEFEAVRRTWDST
jgi:glycosyltransferase involved in cell wall biosynthesis